MGHAWDGELEELRRRRERALAQGGSDRVEREHSKGRRSARERIDLLLDKGSFQEGGMLAGLQKRNLDGEVVEDLPSSLVCGFGRVDGRAVAVGAEDFTVAMSPWPGLYLERAKGVWPPGYIEELAYEWEIPLVMLLQGAGGDVSTGATSAAEPIPAGGTAFPILEQLDVAPAVTAVLGPSGGGSAARAVAAHFAIMSREQGCASTAYSSSLLRCVTRTLKGDPKDVCWLMASLLASRQSSRYFSMTRFS